MRCTVVSGISGHLGREVAGRLLSAGVEVIGITRQDLAADPTLSKAVHIHRIDGRTETLAHIFKEARPDTVFHLAGLSRREHQTADIVPFVDANILLGTQLLEAMRLVGCSRIVTAGSYLQHSDTDGYRAFNLYAATKQAFEELIAFYVDAYELSAVRLTLCDIYSEYDTRPKLMTDIANAWRSATPVHLRDEHARVDLLHVEDVAAAFLRAAALLEDNAIPTRALTRYSVTSGRDITSRELVTLFERLGGREIQITRGEVVPSSRRIKPWRGATLPGWTPQVRLEDGIARILARHRGSGSTPAHGEIVT